MDSLTVLKAGSLKSRCLQGQAPSRGPRRGSSLVSSSLRQPLGAAGVPWLLATSLQPLSPLCLLTAFFPMHLPFPVLPFSGASVTGLRDYPHIRMILSQDLQLIMTSVMTLFPNNPRVRSQSPVPGVTTWIIFTFRGGHHSAHDTQCLCQAVLN